MGIILAGYGDKADSGPMVNPARAGETRAQDGTTGKFVPATDGKSVPGESSKAVARKIAPPERRKLERDARENQDKGRPPKELTGAPSASSEFSKAVARKIAEKPGLRPV